MSVSKSVARSNVSRFGKYPITVAREVSCLEAVFDTDVPNPCVVTPKDHDQEIILVF